MGIASEPSLVDGQESFTLPLTTAALEALYIYEPDNIEPPIINLAPWFGLWWRPCVLKQPLCQTTQNLWRLGQLLERLRVAIGPGCDWLGIYRTTDCSNGTQSLLKLSYIGAASRALFPLTEAFAAGSNNSTCAMTRRAKVVRDTLALKADEPYYE